MKKIAIISLISILFLLIINTSAYATEELYDAVPQEAEEILDDADADDMDSALGKIAGYIKKTAGDVFTEALKNGAAVMLIPVICSLAGTLYNEKLPDVVNIVGVLAAAVLCISSTGSFIGLGNKMLDELDAFSKVLLPSLTTAAAASGAISSAAAKYAAAALFIEILITVGQNVILPLIYAYIAVSIGSAAFGGGLEAVEKLIKWVTVTALTMLVMAFTIYLTVTGVISGTADATATKLTKTALSTALPVVGGIISDAASAVVSGTSMLRNTIGVFGMIVVLSVCITPFMRLGMNYLIFKGASAASGPLGGKGIQKVIGSMGTAMGMVMGLSGSMVVMLYISIISIMKVVT